MQYEKFRYQPNKKSQLLSLLGIAFMIFALFKVINVYKFIRFGAQNGVITPTSSLGVEILVAIIVMLVAFLMSEKLKSYDKNWLYVGVAVTLYSFVKIFILPLSLNKTIRVMIADGHTFKFNPTTWLITVIVSLAISAVCFGVATYIAYVKTNQLQQYYKEMEITDENK